MMRVLSLTFAIATVLGSVAYAAPVTQNKVNLLDVYQLAVDNNADLAAAHADYQAQSERVPQARSGLLPQIGAGASNTNSRSKADTTQGSMTTSRSALVYQASLSQPLFRLDRWYQLQAAQASNEQSFLELSAIEQNLILQSSDVYFSVLRAQDNLAASRAEESAFKRQFDLASERFDVGLSDKTDVLQAQAAYDAARANRLVAERMVSDAFQAVTTLTNVDLAALEGVKHSLPILAPTPNDATAWVNTATEQNLGLQAINFAVQAAQDSVKQRKSGHAPTVDAIAQYQKGDNDGMGFINSGQSPRFDGNAEQSSIGLQLNIPLYTGGMTSSQVREGVHRLDQAEQMRESLRRKTVQDARNFYRAVNTDVEQVQALKQAIISSQSAVEATQIGYEVGTRNIVDVLDAQRVLYAAVRNYNNARYDYILNNLRLQQTAGTLSPDNLQALSAYLNPDYDPDSDFLPPDLDQAIEENLRRR
ncbi:TolC family outer membrane protein [Pseudomonas sp. C27(2019)]|uniref:TolC family outer membrane protein n=1 Tax=Pseudomonas sp. C27(2019) TaxID=2604941 RepID=UPI0012492470|nr:TolC family outer membrane protein [Pseudomonas sp. C27(2019)]QEY60342.1 TolC family outer membrane protein [Pseudomonas sp. C27(2019)]